MKEELQGKLVEILASIQMAAGKASDFAMEQLPEIAQSYVMYGRIESVATVLGFSVLCAVGLWLVHRGVTIRSSFAAAYEAKHDGQHPPFYEGPDTFFWIMPGALIAACGVVLVMLSVKSALLVWFAPKVWLLKEIAYMVK